ncbi:esterase E4-like [Achroia grisella]|uniref:esterase E4-like n=1 Tax=Achroia grisella TaxID=688607 RepID=UPI0027D215DC|nr:esterase E4-like [Achroia grisella]XP_059046860.1 esterase E4-like [Achroia grisella]XP_059046861.1 esterase E4-like [Achroia grisella]
MTCQVRVAQGVLQGKKCTTYNGKEYYSFEGIPYAKPPIGKLRFQNPQDPEGWSGVRDATKPGNKCAQLNLRDGQIIGSEDCLYLNVYTPSLPAEKLEKLPVLFYVHGGSFLVGYGDWYRPDHYIQHDVIFVTVNYRLHVLGFLSLHLPEATGNMAFKDTAKALRWVNQNIANFNGNANNVTVFGESAGSAIVTSYLVSKMTDGLFSKIIGQSGSLVSDLLIKDENPVEKASHLASLLGKNIQDKKELLNFFIDMPVEDLINGYFTAEFSKSLYVIEPFLIPVIEKDVGPESFFDEYPIETIRKNRHKKVPMIIGISVFEAGLFIRRDAEGNIIYENDFKHFVPKYLNLKYDSPKSLEVIKRMRDFYFKGQQVNENLLEKFVVFLSDVYFNRDIILIPELMRNNQDNVFFYIFSFVGSINVKALKGLGIKGTTHGDIVQYEFYKKNKFDQCTERDRQLIQFLSEAWCNFAKNGTPTWTNQEVVWEPYRGETRACLEIDDKKKMITLPMHSRYKFWTDLCGDRSKL